MANSAFTPTNLGTGSSSSSGSGGTNYLSSHFAADALGTVTLSVGDTLASSTRSSPTTWGTSAGSAIISQSADSTLRGSTNYLVAFTANAQFIESPLFTLDGSDLSKPLLVQFDVSGVSTSDDVQCYVVRYNSSNVLQERITVAGTASATTPFSARVPTGTTTFRGFFVPNATASDKYAVRWLRNANNTSMRLDSFIVGPQSIGVGTPYSTWQNYTPSLSGGFGTVSALSAKWQRVGSNIQVTGSFTLGTVAASLGAIFLPTGLTLDTTKLNYSNNTSNAGDSVGWFQQQAAGAARTASLVTAPLTSTSAVYVANLITIGNTLIPTSIITGFDNNGLVSFSFTVPIAEWAGSANNSTQADRAVEEYASNDGSAGVAANNTYNTGMQYGISGSQFPAVASTTATSTTRYLVRFKQALQPTDKVFIEVFNSTSGEWADISYWSRTGIKPLVNQNDSFYGMAWEAVGTSAPTDIYVSFGNKGRNPSATAGAGFGANGQAWSDIAGTSAYLWRVRKVSGGATVGYPVSSANVVGRTDGNAPAAGMAGEFSLSGTSVRNGTGGYTFSNRNNNATTTSFAPYASLTLNKGVYLVSYALTAYQSSGTSDVFTYLAIGGTQVTLTQEGYPGSGGTQSYHNHTQCVPVVITSDNTTVAVYIRTSGSVGTQTSEMYAVRIA